MENSTLLSKTLVFILQNLGFILFIYVVLTICVVSIFFYLLFKIKSLLEVIALNPTKNNTKKVIYDNREKVGFPIIEDESQDWICPKCSDINDKNVYKCKSCGYSLV